MGPTPDLLPYFGRPVRPFGLAFLLLLVTFRSIVIPIKALILNLLSVGAAYGVLVLIFQQGHLQSLLGFKSIGGVIDWLPLFLFVILFSKAGAGIKRARQRSPTWRARDGYGLAQDCPEVRETVRHGFVRHVDYHSPCRRARKAGLEVVIAIAFVCDRADGDGGIG